MSAPTTDCPGPQSWPVLRRPDKAMRAVVFREFGPPDVLHEESVPTPTPGPGEILVQVAAVSVGRLLDLAARAGRHPYPGFAFPHVLGAEHAGVVAALGPGVDGWQEGERVATFPVITDGTCHACRRGDDELCPALQLVGIHQPGAYAEYVVVPSRNIHRVPEDVSPTQATGLALAGAVATNQFLRAGLHADQWVLVHGASSALGSVTASLARHLGAHVIATSRSPDKRRGIAELALDAVLDPIQPEFAEQVRALTGGRGVDIAIDNLGDARIWATTQNCLAAGGAVVSSGAFLGPTVSLDLHRLYVQGQRIIGVRTGNRASATALWQHVAEGFRPVIDTTFPLSDAAKAHTYVQDDLNLGRVALLP